MKTSPEGIGFICSHEGFVGSTYKDAAGLDTIGYGHLIKPGETFPASITEQRARELLAEDLLEAETIVNALVLVPLTQHQFDAVTSFVFNIGYGQFSGSTFLKLLNLGDYAAAADQLPRWNKANGQVLRGLIRRRDAERTMFLKA